MHKGFTVFLPHPGVPTTKLTQIYLSPARLHSLGAPWVSVDQSVVDQAHKVNVGPTMSLSLLSDIA